MKKCILSILENIFIGVVLSILLLELFHTFIIDIVITNIFCKIDFSNMAVKMMSFIILIIACYRLAYNMRKNDVPDIKLVSGIFIITIVYTYFRVTPHNNIHFVDFYNSIKYGDAIYLVFFTLCIMLLYICIRIHHQKKYKINPHKHSKLANTDEITPKVNTKDDPIKHRSEDRLNFYDNVKYLLEKIIKGADYYKDRAICITISAPWGAGKTSYLNLLQFAVEKDTDSVFYNEAIIVKFNPWFCSTPDRMIQDFMSTLSNTLNKYNPNISSELIYYSKILSKAQLGWFSNLIDICFNSKEDAIEKQFSKISECIRLIRKPIIIFIDDIDRLYPDEIIRVLQLVRNTANFKNTIFIIPYDKDHVYKALRRLGIRKEYLDKIFTHPHYLPPLAQEKMRIVLSDIISTKLMANNEDKELIKVFLDDIFDDKLSIRLIKRLIDQLTLSQSRLNSLGLNDMFLYDLLMIEYIKLNYYNLYEIISNVGFFYLNNDIMMIDGKKCERAHDVTNTEYYEQYIAPKIKNEIDKDLGLKLLKLIFDENIRGKNATRLMCPNIFSAYFNRSQNVFSN